MISSLMKSQMMKQSEVWLQRCLEKKKKQNNDGIAGDEGVQRERESNKGEGRMPRE